MKFIFGNGNSSKSKVHAYCLSNGKSLLSLNVKNIFEFMPNSKRPKLPTFQIIPDSSVLFNEKPADLVSPGFETLWNELSKFANLQLFIPSVVVGERMFQMMWIARESLKNAQKSHGTITSIFGNEIPTLPSEDEILKGIKNRFQLWCHKLNAEILPTPIGKIDWNLIVEASMWRKAPFTHEGNPKTEKGFRDCLVLETLMDFETANPNQNIVFLSNDGLLRETATNRLGQKEMRHVYNNLEAFGSYIKLVHEKLTNEFVDLLIKKVGQVFYEESVQDCVYFKYGIPERIQNQFATILNSPQEPDGLGLSAALLLLNPVTNATEWKSASDQQNFVYATEFVKLEGKDIFHWKSPVELVQLFAKNPESETSFINERIRKSTFDVFWTAQVSDDGVFSNLKLLEIKEAQQIFQHTTIEEKKELGFRIHPLELSTQRTNISSALGDYLSKTPPQNPFLLGNLPFISTDILTPPKSPSSEK